VVVPAAVAGAAILAVVAGRTIAGAGIGRRLALMAETDDLVLATAWATGNRRVVRAANQPCIADLPRPALADAALLFAIGLVAMLLFDAAARSIGQVGSVRTTDQPRVAGALGPAVAAAAVAGTARRLWAARIAAGHRGGAGARAAGRSARIVRAAEERRRTASVLDPGSAGAADAGSRRIGADGQRRWGRALGKRRFARAKDGRQRARRRTANGHSAREAAGERPCESFEARRVHERLSYRPPMLQPPSTIVTAPVMYRARSEARNATTSATSSGSPKRPSNVRSTTPE
jgi:hypothetical protein